MDNFDFITTRRTKVIILYLNSNKDKNKAMIISSVSRGTGTAYSHTSKIISRLEDSGLVIAKKIGRIKAVTLSKKGRRFAQNLEMIKKLWEDKQLKKE